MFFVFSKKIPTIDNHTAVTQPTLVDWDGLNHAFVQQATHRLVAVPMDPQVQHFYARYNGHGHVE